MKRSALMAGMLALGITAAAENAMLEKAYAAECRRSEIAGKVVPGQTAARSPASRKKAVERADKICGGIVFFDNLGTDEPITVGKRNIDWRGGQRNHQEWVAQLNRFFMLSQIASAWVITGDEKYPARARELMEDYMDAIAKES